MSTKSNSSSSSQSRLRSISNGNILPLTNIYCLSCEDDTYYIGKAKNVEKRFRKHCQGGGSIWTRAHRPIEIIEIRRGVSPFEEEKVVKEYMFHYGIDKVRGGSYNHIELNSCQLYNLRRELWMASDCCFQCGEKHYCRDCQALIVPKNLFVGGTFGLVFLCILVLLLVSQIKLNWNWHWSC